MAIHINQVGYFNNGKKTAVFTAGNSFMLCKNDNHDVVLSGKLPDLKWDETSGDMTCIGDFSEYQIEGEFYLKNDLDEISQPFSITRNPYENLKKDVLKAFYYQRCGCELEEKYAGIFKHPVCHTKKVCELENRSVEKTVNGGWHDAGDYGRYVTAGATALGHMLYGYLLFPQQWEEQTGIPESGNGISDL